MIPTRLRAAHPRSRGENKEGRRSRCLPSGSSPLTRGKRVQERAHGLVGRLIPAHAGKTLTLASGGVEAPAHPRSRGEN